MHHIPFEEMFYHPSRERATTVVQADKASNSISKAPRQKPNDHISHPCARVPSAGGTISRLNQYLNIEKDTDVDKELLLNDLTST